MAKTNGSIIGPANIPTGAFGSAPGVWKLSEAEQYKKEGIWPVATTGFQVANSLRFDDGSSDYLNRTPSTASNRKTWTWSGWVKRSTLATNQGLFRVDLGTTAFQFYFATDDHLVLYAYSSSGGVTEFYLETNQVFRDVSSWYHVVLAVDTTNGTADNRGRIYVNGSEVTSFEFRTNPSLNFDTDINTTNSHLIGGAASYYFDGYMAEVVFIDGQQLTPSSFGETDATTNNWIPKDVSGLTFGTNGFYLPFQNASALGQDDSGNGNNFTVNNLTSIDQCIDSPTNNFVTLNPLKPTTDGTFSNGNLTLVYGTSATRNIGQGTFGVSSGKWYWECKISGSVSPNNAIIGITSKSNDTDTVLGTSAFNYGYRGYDGAVYNNNSSVASYNTFGLNDIIGIALDLDGNKLYFYKNGTIQDASGIDISGATVTDGFWFAGASDAGSSATPQFDFNFGNAPFTISSGNTDYSALGNFEYSVPSGYRALCTKNIGLVG